MKTRPFLASTALGVAALWGSQALAQEGPVDEEEISLDTRGDEVSQEDEVKKLGAVTVTVRRREEQLSDVPTAASVISGDALDARGGAQTSGDLLADQPSVRFNNLTSAITSEISIRASSTARATNGDPSIGLYRNGSYIGGGGQGGRNFTLIDFLDIGRVEVLRGTQGALYGRNAVGGAINIVSAQPEFETSGFASGRYGIENQNGQLKFAVNQAASENVAFRFSGQVIDQGDGFFYNPDNDVYFDQQDGFALRGQARIAEGPFDGVLTVEKQELTTPAIPYRIYIEPGTPGFPGGYIQDQFSYPWNTPPRAIQDVDSIQFAASIDLGWADLSSTTLFRQRKSQYDLDADGVNPEELAEAKSDGRILPFVPIDPNSQAYVADETESFNQDVHLTGDALDGRLEWLFGGEMLLQSSNYSVDRLGSAGGTSQPVSLDYDSYAVYGSLGYDFTDRFNLTGEMRYTQDDRSLMARLRDINTGVPVGGAATSVDAEIEPDNLSYNFTASFNFTPDILGYGKVGTSYRAGGFNTNLGDARQPVPIPAAYGDETSTSYEIGLKGNLASNAYFAMAGYLTDLEDLIAQTDNGCSVTLPECPVASTSFLTNAGDAQSWGVEGELTTLFDLAGGDLRVALSASRQDGEVQSGEYEGLELPQVPEWLASASLNYRRPIGGQVEIFGNLLYSGQWGGKQELLVNSVPLYDYELVDLRAGATFGRFTVAAFAKNIFDEVYLIAETASIRRYSQPRLTGVELRYAW